MAFKTKGQLNDHRHRHSDLRPFKCSLCQSTFNRKTRLKVHLMIHSGKKPFKCNYPGCEKDFREKGNLTSHLKKHTNEMKEAKDGKVSQDESKDSTMKSTLSNNGWISVCNESNFNKSNYNSNKEEDLLSFVNPQSLLIDMMYESETSDNHVFHLNDFNLDGFPEKIGDIDN